VIAEGGVKGEIARHVIVQLRRVSAPHEASPAQDRQSSRAVEVPPRADRRR